MSGVDRSRQLVRLTGGKPWRHVGWSEVLDERGHYKYKESSWVGMPRPRK